MHIQFVVLFGYTATDVGHCYEFENSDILLLSYTWYMNYHDKYDTIINLVRVIYDGLSTRERLCHPRGYNPPYKVYNCFITWNILHSAIIIWSSSYLTTYTKY